MKQTGNDVIDNNMKEDEEKNDRKSEKNSNTSEERNSSESNNENNNDSNDDKNDDSNDEKNDEKNDDNSSINDNENNKSYHNKNSKINVNVSTGNDNACSALSESLRECKIQDPALELQQAIDAEVEVEAEEAGEDGDTTFSNESKQSAKCIRLQSVLKNIESESEVEVEVEECSSPSYNSPSPSGIIFFKLLFFVSSLFLVQFL